MIWIIEFWVEPESRYEMWMNTSLESLVFKNVKIISMVWVIIHSCTQMKPQINSLLFCEQGYTSFITVKKYGVYMVWVICILFNNITSVDLGEVWHRLNTPYACYCIIYNTFSATSTAWFPFSQLKCYVKFNVG